MDIDEIIDSWINGNISWVKGKVKNMTKKEFMELVDRYGEVIQDHKLAVHECRGMVS